MRPKSLRYTLLIGIAVVVIISGLMISQLITHRYSVSLMEGAVAQAENAAHKLALDAAEGILINDLVALQRMLDAQMAVNPTVAYIFVVREGEVVSHTFSDGVPYDLIHANEPAGGEKGHLEKIVSEKGSRFLDIAWPIFGGRAGTLRIGFSEEPYRKKVADLWLEISLITVLILAGALAAGHLFVFRLTRPLLKLADDVEAVGEENLALLAPVKGRAEVTRLASAFNTMISRLKEYTGRLEASNQELARKHQELDLAHRRMRLSLSITQELAALSDLKEVSAYLIRAFKGIVVCRSMTLVVFSSRGDEAYVTSDRGTVGMGAAAAGAAREAMAGLQGVSFVEKEKLTGVPLPFDLQSARQLAVLPFHHHQELLGAIVIGCPQACSCVTRELDAIELILNQTAGAMRRAVRHEEEIRDLRARIEPTDGFCGMVGKDPKMQVVYKLIEDVAPTDATVLIQGESGTGKELVARAIHQQSPRSDKPFVVINCSAYPSTLLESELFGNEKGAFTGASRRRVGRFEQAHGGTVFLDEIGEIPPTAQIKLLRVLQSQKFERLGGEQTLSVDVRILAATNKNLLEQVKAGAFREDLFYRLNVIPIHMPPLRERRNDVPILARYFLKKFAGKQAKGVAGLNSEAMRALLSYTWPGNVRELENTIEHAVVLAKGEVVEVFDLPGPLVDRPAAEAPAPDKTIEKNEARLLREVLEECNWNKTLAATRLGISRSTLYEKIKKYQLYPPTLH